MTSIRMESGGVLRVPPHLTDALSLNGGDTLLCFAENRTLRLMPEANGSQAGFPCQTGFLRHMLRRAVLL